MESKQILSIVKDIQSKVDSMDYTLEYMLKIDGQKIIDSYLKQFKENTFLKELYLLIDGKLSQKEIIEIINQSQSLSNPTATRRIEILREMGLIVQIDSRGGSPIYAKTKIERIFKLGSKIK